MLPSPSQSAALKSVLKTLRKYSGGALALASAPVDPSRSTSVKYSGFDPFISVDAAWRLPPSGARGETFSHSRSSRLRQRHFRWFLPHSLVRRLIMVEVATAAVFHRMHCPPVDEVAVALIHCVLFESRARPRRFPRLDAVEESMTFVVSMIFPVRGKRRHRLFERWQIFIGLPARIINFLHASAYHDSSAPPLYSTVRSVL